MKKTSLILFYTFATIFTTIIISNSNLILPDKVETIEGLPPASLSDTEMQKLLLSDQTKRFEIEVLRQKAPLEYRIALIFFSWLPFGLIFLWQRKKS